MADTTDIENQDSTNADDAQVQESETTEAVDVEALQELNKQLYERTKKAEAEAKALKSQNKTESQTSETKNSSLGSEDERFERLDLKTDGYKNDEIDFIMQNGGRSSLDNPLVKAAINAQRKAVTSRDATPSGTNKSPVYQKFTERDLKNMPTDELEKILPQD